MKTRSLLQPWVRIRKLQEPLLWETEKLAIRKGVRHWHLPFSALCVESSLIFLLQKDKKKEKKIHKVHIWIIQPLINLNELQFDKMKYTLLCFLDYNLMENYKALFPRLQSTKEKEKDNALS